jgi:Pentapeptide repeats (8 copies)
MMNAKEQLRSKLQTGAHIRELDLCGVDLSGADLMRLRADGVKLSGALLAECKLQGSRFCECDFVETSVERADFTGAVIRLCQMDRLRADSVTIVRARFEDSSAEGADFKCANFSETRLSETSFARAVLRSIVLDSAEGAGIVFRGADLTEASLVRANFPEADFRGADLSRANLTNASLRNADFRGAILDGAQWTDADLYGAVFDTDANPAQSKDFASDPAGPPQYEKEIESMTRWVEGLLKSAPDGTAGISQRLALPHLREPGDSTELRDLLKTLEKTLASRGLQGEKILSSFQNLLNILENAPENEPPEAWKPAISQLLNRLPGAGQEPNIIEIFNLLLETISQPPGPQSAPQTQDDADVQSEADSNIERGKTGAEQPESGGKPST